MKIMMNSGKELPVIAGENLPMLITALDFREECSASELMDTVLKAGREGCVNITYEISESKKKMKDG